MSVSGHILNKPLLELTFSNDFLVMAEANHFVSLSDIVKMPTYELLKLPGFSYHLLLELISVLRKNNLLEFLKET